MIKAAILFSGLPRCIDENSSNHLEYFQNTEDIQFDYYIHTCETKEKEESLRNKLQEIYNPKAMLIEQQDENYQPEKDCNTIFAARDLLYSNWRLKRAEDWLNKREQLHPHDLYQFYTWYKSAEVFNDHVLGKCESKAKGYWNGMYDIVIKMRFDVLFVPETNKINPELLHKHGGLSSIVLVAGGSNYFAKHEDVVTTDTFFFGPPDLMSLLFYSVYKNELKDILNRDPHMRVALMAFWTEQKIHRALTDNISNIVIPSRIITGKTIAVYGTRCDKENYSYLSSKGE